MEEIMAHANTKPLNGDKKRQPGKNWRQNQNKRGAKQAGSKKKRKK